MKPVSPDDIKYAKALVIRGVYFFIVQIFVLLGAAKIAGELFKKFKQPAFIKEEYFL